MVAVDTNILIRLLTGDDPQQAASVRTLFDRSPIWIAKTVLLETGWVLRGHYEFEESAIREAFKKLSGLPNVHLEDESAVATALDLVGQGLDLADALHLVSRPADASFVSLDKSFVKRAKRAGVTVISAA